MSSQEAASRGNSLSLSKESMEPFAACTIVRSENILPHDTPTPHQPSSPPHVSPPHVSPLLPYVTCEPPSSAGSTAHLP